MFKCPYEGKHCMSDYLGSDGLCDADTLPVWQYQNKECKKAKENEKLINQGETMSKVDSLTVRLMLRSIYLKGHQDGNLKTSDISWEDKILEDFHQMIEGLKKDMSDSACVSSEDVFYNVAIDDVLSLFKVRRCMTRARKKRFNSLEDYIKYYFPNEWKNRKKVCIYCGAKIQDKICHYLELPTTKKEGR